MVPTAAAGSDPAAVLFLGICAPTVAARSRAGGCRRQRRRAIRPPQWHVQGACWRAAPVGGSGGMSQHDHVPCGLGGAPNDEPPQEWRATSCRVPLRMRLEQGSVRDGSPPRRPARSRGSRQGCACAQLRPCTRGCPTADHRQDGPGNAGGTCGERRGERGGGGRPQLGFGRQGAVSPGAPRGLQAPGHCSQRPSSERGRRAGPAVSMNACRVCRSPAFTRPPAGRPAHYTGLLATQRFSNRTVLGLRTLPAL